MLFSVEKRAFGYDFVRVGGLTSGAKAPETQRLLRKRGSTQTDAEHMLCIRLCAKYWLRPRNFRNGLL